ncbi:Uncharacterized protein OBRU01_22286, partial [Operophtera brumata]
MVYFPPQSMSWGSMSRLGWEGGSPPPPPPADDIIALCACTHWTEHEQLRRLTELLNKMFVDAHTKVFSLLLDALCELLLVHWQQLKDWLYQLMFSVFRRVDRIFSGFAQAIQCAAAAVCRCGANGVAGRALTKVAALAADPRAADVKACARPAGGDSPVRAGGHSAAEDVHSRI